MAAESESESESVDGQVDELGSGSIDLVGALGEMRALDDDPWRPMQVEFEGENGIDMGGLRVEAVRLVIVRSLRGPGGLFDRGGDGDSLAMPSASAPAGQLATFGALVARCAASGSAVSSLWDLPLLIYRFLLAASDAEAEAVLRSATRDEALGFMGGAASLRLESLSYAADADLRGSRGASQTARRGARSRNPQAAAGPRTRAPSQP